MANVFFSIGSNEGERFSNLESAIKQLSQIIGNIHMSSEIYESEPWGYKDQSQYLNQVVWIKTDMMPDDILKAAMKIENCLGRTRSEWKGYESRTMDIDLLVYDLLKISTIDLIVPHPKMHLRNFVLIPFDEIAPEVIHPEFRMTIGKLKETCNDKSRVSLVKRHK